MVGFTVNLGSYSVLAVEIWGVIYRLRLSWDRGVRLLILEVDNKYVVDILSSRNYCPCQSLALFSEVQRLLHKYWKVQVIHSYREANCYADFLANEGIKGPLGFRRLDVPPDGIKDLMFYDTVGAAYLRMCLL